MIDQSANADALHWRFSFLQTLRETGNVSAAARHVGKSRAAVYRARKQDDAFAADEAENSLWARQTRHRATDIAARLRGLNKN
jgi:hypothetical protein